MAQQSPRAPAQEIDSRVGFELSSAAYEECDESERQCNGGSGSEEVEIQGDRKIEALAEAVGMGQPGNCRAEQERETRGPDSSDGPGKSRDQRG